MKTKLLGGFGLFFAFLLFLLATAPATVLTRSTTSFVPALGFVGVKGSLWRGDVAQLRFRELSLTNLRWQLSPWQLFLGKAVVQFEFDDGVNQRGSGRVLAGFGGAISAEQLSLQLPAQALQPLIKLTGVQLGGEIQVEIADAAFNAARMERLQGRIVWLQAQVKTPLGQPMLGAYAVDLGGDGEGGINGDITDVEGVLGLSGRFHVNMHRLELDASVRSDLPEELDRFFRVIGRPDGDRYALRWEQTFGN